MIIALKHQLNSLFLLVGFALFTSISGWSQCTLKAYATKTTIGCGDSLQLSASSDGCISFAETFESGKFDLSRWSDSTEAVVTDGSGIYGCVGAAPEGNKYMWIQGKTAGVRRVVTSAIDMSNCTGTATSLQFEIKFGVQGTNVPCEGIDLAHEGIHVQYSIDNGATWTELHYFDINQDMRLTNWTSINLDLPIAAITNHTQFRWLQLGNSGVGYDSWGLDDILLNFVEPNATFEWKHQGIANSTPNNHFVKPTQFTTYEIKKRVGADSCVASISVDVLRPTISIGVSDSVLCKGGEVNLKVFKNEGVAPESTCGVATDAACPFYFSTNEEKTVSIGNPVSINYNDISDALLGKFGDAYNTNQILFRAQELTAAGITAGKINSLTVDVERIESNGQPNLQTVSYPFLRISMGCTNATVMQTYLSTTEVYNTTDEVIHPGKHTFFFDKGYNWDGTTNIVIQLCWAYPNGEAAQYNNGTYAFCKSENTSFNSYRSSTSNFAMNLCDKDDFVTYSKTRPRLTFGFCKPDTAAYTYQWTSTNGFSNISANTVDQPNQSTTYTLSAQKPGIPTDCAVTASQSVIVYQPTVTLAADRDTVCANAEVVFNATAATTAGIRELYLFEETLSNGGFVIPDNTGGALTAEMNVDQAGSINGVFKRIKVKIQHPNTKDLILKIVAPNNDTILLTNKRGAGANYTQTYFSYNVNDASIVVGSAPFTGSYRSEENLQDFVSQGDGLWKLIIKDNAKPALGGSAGKLLNWGIEFEGDNSIQNYSWSAPQHTTVDTTSNVFKAVIDTTVQYTVTVKDATGCTNTAHYNIYVNDSDSPTFDLSDTACVNSQAVILPTTSVNGFAGNWMPSAVETDSIGSFQYQFIATATGCITLYNLEVLGGVATFVAIPATYCSKGDFPTLTAISDEGVAGTWQPSTVMVGTNAYTFTPSLSECIESVEKTIVVTEAINPTFIPNSYTICEDAQVPTLVGTSSNGINGTWNPTTVSNSVDSTYLFTPNAGICAYTTTIHVNVTENVLPSFDSIPPICVNATPPVLPSTSKNGVEGTWDPSVINNQVTTTYTFTPNGDTCAVVAMLLVAVETCADIDKNSAFSWSVYPNPVSGQLNIVSTTAGLTPQFELFDMVGKLVNVNPVVVGSTWELDVNELANGSYTLVIVSNEHVSNYKIEVLH